MLISLGLFIVFAGFSLEKIKIGPNNNKRVINKVPNPHLNL